MLSSSQQSLPQALNATLRGCADAADTLMELLWPKRCVGCERLGVLLCRDCLSKAPLINRATACPRCGAPHGMLVCTECYTSEGPLQLSFSAAVSALLFEGWAARLVVIYKDQHEQRLAETCAALLDAAIPQQWLSWADAATYIPADASKVRERGFDHMRLLCQHLARRLGLAWRDCLVKNASGDQRRLNREQRAENLAEAFSHTGRQGIEGKRLLLIDDVYTTGATLQQAAAALLGAGAAEVRVATVCRVY